MRASIVIPTYNGAHKITHLLKSLVNQTTKDFEVIVVVDGSVDNTVECVTPYQNSFLSFKIVAQSNRGRSASRNAGAKLAQSGLLIFCDDDMRPQPESIVQHFHFHAGNAGCLLAGNQIENHSASNSDIQNYKAFISEKWMRKYENDVSIMKTDNLFFSSANCSMPTKIFRQLKGFDEQLTDGEDFDLAFRAIKENIPVYFDKRNESVHHDKITCLSYIRRVRQYAAARNEWENNHSDSSNSVSRSGAKRLIYSIFAHRYWVKAIDREFFLLLPKMIRYKLYDVIIQAMAVEFPKAKLE